MMKEKTDFLIVGAGIIGVNIAIALQRKFPDSSITIIEKEDQIGMHASGRNSGVLHAGFYYSSNSLKARFCREGNKQLTNFCLERGLPINQCGKLIVTENSDQLRGLDELFNRGLDNNVELIELDEQEVQEIEPRAKTFQRGLFSPTTSTVNPIRVIQSLVDYLVTVNVEIKKNTAFIEKKGKVVQTSNGKIEAGYLINTAGLYADKIAMKYGFSNNFRIVPFKGLYLYANLNTLNLKTNVYPVPDLNNPFLGVHFTVDVEGRTKIGPSAMPAFWREQYNGFENFNLREMMEILIRDANLFLFNHFDFRNTALDELKKYSKKRMVKAAANLISNLSLKSVDNWGQPGIRAQLINLAEKKLEMDFIFEGDDRSFHVLNAVSPAFTCSKPFADYLVDRIAENLC